MTKVTIISGSNGSGKSLFLNNFFEEYKDNSLYLDDFIIFKNMNVDVFKSSGLSRGQFKHYKILTESDMSMKNDYNLIIDDIDTYLHNNILENLISEIIENNPKIKHLIVSTHSPILIMKSWQHCVLNIEDIRNYDEFKLFLINK